MFYKTFRRVATEAGLTECRLCRSLYYFLDKDGNMVILLGAHLDDVIWAAAPEYEHIVTEKLPGKFELNKIEEGNFRFCGREYSQDDDFNVYVTCKDNTEKILPIKLDQKGRTADEKATAGEIAQARSVIGSLSWIAREVRPDLCYQTSRLQSNVASAQVKHLTQCNKIMQEAKA